MFLSDNYITVKGVFQLKKTEIIWKLITNYNLDHLNVCHFLLPVISLLSLMKNWQCVDFRKREKKELCESFPFVSWNYKTENELSYEQEKENPQLGDFLLNNRYILLVVVRITLCSLNSFTISFEAF